MEREKKQQMSGLGWAGLGWQGRLARCMGEARDNELGEGKGRPVHAHVRFGLAAAIKFPR